ncbi:hypothetical protein MTO96_011591 [Rhipicephalus appendiculatus]
MRTVGIESQSERPRCRHPRFWEMVHADIAGSPCVEEERRPNSSGKAWLHSVLSWRAARAEEKGNARGSSQRGPIQAAAAERHE